MSNLLYSYLVIEGNIGAGKTSLATMLAKEYNANLILEQFEENDFLPKFYENPDKYAFPLELSFLASRYQQLINQLNMPDLFVEHKIADYFVDKCQIFAKKTLQNDEFKLFRKLFQIISAQLPQPDLLVYLHKTSQHLKKNILTRGRSYEKNISLNYLNNIQESYMEYILNSTFKKVLIIDTTNIDFVNNKSDYELIKKYICKDIPDGIHKI